MLPPSQPSDLESSLWDYSQSLFGRLKVDLNFLKTRFPEHEIKVLSEVLPEGFGKGYKIIGFKRPEIGSVYLAYQCNACQQIMTGLPVFENERISGLLSGRDGFNMRCADCNIILASVTYRQS